MHSASWHHQLPTAHKKNQLWVKEAGTQKERIMWKQNPDLPILKTPSQKHMKTVNPLTWIRMRACKGWRSLAKLAEPDVWREFWVMQWCANSPNHLFHTQSSFDLHTCHWRSMLRNHRYCSQTTKSTSIFLTGNGSKRAWFLSRRLHILPAKSQLARMLNQVGYFLNAVSLSDLQDIHLHMNTAELPLFCPRYTWRLTSTHWSSVMGTIIYHSKPFCRSIWTSSSVTSSTAAFL
jgi:hypothetical protein